MATLGNLPDLLRVLITILIIGARHGICENSKQPTGLRNYSRFGSSIRYRNILRLLWAFRSIGTIVDELDAIGGQLSQLERESPDIPDPLYDQARREQLHDQEGM